MKGIFPGSFDPPTRGHLDLIRRAASMMDHLTICVMVNISKAGTIPTEERVRMLEKACRDIPNVSVDRWDGLLADYMRRQEPGTAVIRGVRSSVEFEQERTAAAVNHALYPGRNSYLQHLFQHIPGYSHGAEIKQDRCVPESQDGADTVHAHG